MKICTKCKEYKKLTEFDKDVSRKDGYRYICKQCGKLYRKQFSKLIKERDRKRYRKNSKIKKKNQRIYNKSKSNFDTYAQQISFADPVKNVDGFLQTKCAYCGKWYFPTTVSVQNRIKSLNGKSTEGSEQRLYCSNNCKQECPIYHRKIWPKGFKLSTSREVQPELRQMVLKRDNYTCQKCGKHQDELETGLHCHHIEGIRWEPIESADIDKCITVCKQCHKEIHKKEGCKYHEMKCN